MSDELIIRKGKTFTDVIRLEGSRKAYKAITAIARTAPVRITVPSHGAPPGWRVAVVSVVGMVEMNAEANNVTDRDYHDATVIDADTIELNDINAAGFKPYISGGYVQYNEPLDLTSYDAVMSIQDKKEGTELFRLDVTNGRLVINNITKTITRTISAADTKLIAFKRAVYELEASSPGKVTFMADGAVTVLADGTT